MEQLEHFLAVVKETINPVTQPVGVTMVRDLALIAGKKIRVKGQRLTVCQQIAYSRRLVHLGRQADCPLCIGSRLCRVD